MLQPHFTDCKSGIWIGKLLVEDHVAKLNSGAKNGIQDYLNLEFLLRPGRESTVLLKKVTNFAIRTQPEERASQQTYQELGRRAFMLKYNTGFQSPAMFMIPREKQGMRCGKRGRHEKRYHDTVHTRLLRAHPRNM